MIKKYCDVCGNQMVGRDLTKFHRQFGRLTITILYRCDEEEPEIVDLCNTCLLDAALKGKQV